MLVATKQDLEHLREVELHEGEALASQYKIAFSEVIFKIAFSEVIFKSLSVLINSKRPGVGRWEPGPSDSFAQLFSSSGFAEFCKQTKMRL